jgi:hypothetical protein
MATTIDVVLKNNTNSPNLFAHITGQDGRGLVLLQADGRSLYHPGSPGGTLQPLGADCAINVGGPGQSRTLTVPRIFGARVWFCKDRPLTFLLNPGPALVEPSATNPADPNYNADWGFAEFTYNQYELYANVSYVDFVSLPVSLRLETASGTVKSVDGMPAGALQAVSERLLQQGARDGKGWDRLVIRSPSGETLRALSPNSGAVLIPGLFDGYFQPHVDAVWDKYRNENLVVNSQFTWGDVTGRVGGDGLLTFSNDGGSFAKPSARDIFSCNSGPFDHSGASQLKLNIGARISAALNRSTLLINPRQPEGERVETYYRDAVTNHYSRAVHEVAINGRGYAFPYDDVGSSNGVDQSGFVNDPNPRVLTIAIGAPL